jgi:hypothetical protein
LTDGPRDQREESIGGLFRRLLDEGSALVRAEANLYQQIALARLEKAKAGAIACASGILLAFAALVVLLVMAALALAVRIGPLAAGLIVAGLALLLALGLFRYGAGRLTALGGDDEERRALDRGEADA